MKTRFYSILITVVCYALPTEVIAQKYHESAKLTSLDRHIDSQIGADVDLHGNYAIIGAPREYLDANGKDSIQQAGAVYIMELNVHGEWIQTAKLTPKKRDRIDYFGSEVKINDRFAVVGSYFKKTLKSGRNELSSGAVYIYERDAMGTWSLLQEIIPDDKEASQNFGWSIDFKEHKMIIGSPLNNLKNEDGETIKSVGSAYVYNYTEAKKWHFVQKLTPSDGASNDYFGHDVSLDDETIIVGAIRESDILIDKKYKDNMGAAYVFELDKDGHWSETQKIVASDRKIGNGFGGSVLVYKDEIIVGDYHYTNYFGRDTVDYSGAVYVFKKSTNGTWEETQVFKELDNPENEYFGISIDMSKDVLCVGAIFYYESINGLSSKVHGGGAKIYKRDPDGSWSFNQLIHGKDRNHYDESGGAVAIYDDMILMASRRNDYDENQENYVKDAGAIYLFETCTPQRTEIDHEVCDSLVAPSGRWTWYSSGTYYDTLTSTNGCDSILKINLTVQDFSVTIRELDGKLIADAQEAVSFIWYRCLDKTLMPIKGATTMSIRPSESGKYAVGVGNKDRCVAISPCHDFVLTNNENLSLESGVTVYPNPFLDQLNLVSNSGEIEEILIFNVQGKELISRSNIKQDIIKLDLSHLCEGIYFIQIKKEAEQKMYKIIKQ